MPGKTVDGDSGRLRWRVLFWIAISAALIWFSIWFSDHDKKQIDQAVTRAIFAHPVKGTRIPVTLWKGPRILQIKFATVQWPPRRGIDQRPPTTCVSYSMFDPKTGLEDNSGRYAYVTCIEGIAYQIISR